jgi:methylglutamate dehydrogenase subunit D
MDTPTLTSQAAFARFESAATPAPGVVATERMGAAVASVLARKGRMSDLANRLCARYGIELPQGPRVTRAPGIAFVGVGVGAWLAVGDSGGDLANLLRGEIGDCASLTDQSSALPILRVTGPRVRNALAKLLPLDLHDRAFGILNAASSVASHIAVRIWRLEDGEQGAVFELAIPRSFAASFAESLQASAAEFGLTLKSG